MSSAATAQDEMPAVSAGQTPPPPTRDAPRAPVVKEQEVGTNIFAGDKESPIGLDIMPWRESPAERDIDRPARLLQEQMLPVDRVVFERQLEYYDALAGALKSKGLVTPQERR
ncbi:hypothetical protein D0B54_02760 [Solimonas sp. K1W22B-7]|uniref:hypothetical protein n=1 Tax=Solimonas sp. K1W22B-7 TaxID=2303331 RepID=UPI000E332EBB|nr:hypothetical protein [Solimonas sp. K1W22B-7]AXQ27653.1 hypothetical protein D0B54_02760 [Solimonas sp. K1W22B-7]